MLLPMAMTPTGQFAGADFEIIGIPADMSLRPFEGLDGDAGADEISGDRRRSEADPE
jgi:hypothetical protein